VDIDILGHYKSRIYSALIEERVAWLFAIEGPARNLEKGTISVSNLRHKSAISINCIKILYAWMPS
jgi:hypothetical protein